jgi:hypothetical protein
MRKLFLFIAMLLYSSSSLIAQVSINIDNTTPHPSAMLDVKSTSSGILIPRMTSAQRSAITSPATGLMVYQTDGIPGFYYYNGTSWTALAGSSGGTSHYVGELFGGGIVCWVDNTGQHGLIVSLVDLSTGAKWSNSYSTTGAISTWNGAGNSSIILSISPAASLCHNYQNSINYGTGTFQDWYLPAIDQLSLIYNARYILNKNIESAPAPANILPYTWYWSSTENSSSYAWSFYFGSGRTYFNYKDNLSWVRAVRDF